MSIRHVTGVVIIISGVKTPPFRYGDETPSSALCYTVCIPQGLRKSTLVEAALGRDMTVSDQPGNPPRGNGQPKNLPASAVGSGQELTPNGSANQKVEPLPGALRTPTAPWCRSTIVRLMYRPRPSPPPPSAPALAVVGATPGARW